MQYLKNCLLYVYYQITTLIVYSWDDILSYVLSFCRYWSNDIQPPPWNNPDWARTTLLAHNAPVEESYIYATHVPHQVSNRRGSDHHLLRCGGKPAEWKWTLLQVSHCKSVDGTVAPWLEVRQLLSTQNISMEALKRSKNEVLGLS